MPPAPRRTEPRDLRIRGLVRLHDHVRKSLARGIPADQLAGFRRDVRDAVTFVEDACRARGLSPDDLPAQTRAAWRYLRDVDLDRLAPRTEGPTATTAPQIRISHLSAATDALTERVSEFAAGRAPAGLDVAALRTEAEIVARRVRRLVAASGGDLATSLSPPSRLAFATAAFLADAERLDAAIATAAAVHRLDREASARDVAGPRLVVHVQAMQALYRARRAGGALHLRLNLGFLGAPAELLGRAVRGARGRRRSDDRAAWDGWSRGEAFAAVVAELDALTGGARHQPGGRVWDLDALYAELDAAFFEGRVERPALAWSRRPARRRLGRYVAALDQVEISSALDDPAVPREVVAWVLYHEVLHKIVPGRWEGGRLVVHSSEFRVQERLFPDWQRVERWLRRFASA